MKRPLILVAICCVTSAALFLWWSPGGRQMTLPPHPVAEYPDRIDLPAKEVGDQAVGRFRIENRGGQELNIDQVQTSCSCAGIEVEQNGVFHRLGSIRIPSGSGADLVVRVVVRDAPIGMALRSDVTFRTNDPNRPTGLVVLVSDIVTGGVAVKPRSLVFGARRLGDAASEVVEVWDNAAVPRAVERIVPSNPGQVKVKLLPPDGTAAPHKSYGVMVARIEVTAVTDTPGDFNGEILVYVQGRSDKPDRIPLFGRVQPAVECSPSSLILPRQSATGPLNTARFLCRATGGGSLAVEVQKVPPGVSVKLLNADESDSSIKHIEVAWDRNGKDSRPGHHSVLLNVRAGDYTGVLSVPLTLE